MLSVTALFHPYRVAIAAAMIAAGEPLSPVRIKEDYMPTVSLGTVAYHMRYLKREGVVRLVGEKRVRGAVEHYYAIDPGMAEEAVARLHEQAQVMIELARGIRAATAPVAEAV